MEQVEATVMTSAHGHGSPKLACGLSMLLRLATAVSQSRRIYLLRHVNGNGSWARLCLRND
ncbi:hypothetical protein QC762_0013260 [Podospora pseudocomata]|uniref:Uncharacterized protein n=1 Tax=Podospora pseudocomata TaxID=2093779 RepID=A0ABR0GW57_9PEZI|nr:hypothetical protein QC762_0013260 [Podospora pseudocomata]